jgi:hypothetical protein
MKRAAVAVLAAFAATASPAAGEEVPTRDCGSRGDPSNGVPVRFVQRGDVVVGPVSFAGLGPAATVKRLDRGPDGRYFRKVAAKVLWGRPATVSVVAADRERLALAYARPNLRTSAIRFEPCAPGTPMFVTERPLGRVTAFPGGLSFTRRGCYQLEVRVDRGRTYRRTISLGAGRC